DGEPVRRANGRAGQEGRAVCGVPDVQPQNRGDDRPGDRRSGRKHTQRYGCESQAELAHRSGGNCGRESRAGTRVQLGLCGLGRRKSQKQNAAWKAALRKESRPTPENEGWGTRKSTDPPSKMRRWGTRQNAAWKAAP